MVKVFISYAQKDHRLVHSLAGAINERGLEPIVAMTMPMPGARLDDKVRKLIKEADCVLVLCTVVSAKSSWVQQEIGCAKALKKYIVPIKSRSARLTAMLDGYEYYEIKVSDPIADFERIAGLLREWAIERGMEVEPKTDSADVSKFFQIVHLPHALICPRCKNVDNHVAVCFLCGEWVCCHCSETIPPASRAVLSGKRNRSSAGRVPSTKGKIEG